MGNETKENDEMAIYFTADTHFGREEFFTEEYTDRHKFWSNPQEMDEALIKNWNDTVTREDTVFLLGDFSNYDDPIKNQRIWNRLNGKKTLILGNHDTRKRIDERNFPYGRVSFPSCITVNTANWELFLTHFPCLDWTNKYKWIDGVAIAHAIQLYGHVHNNRVPELEGQRAYNVGMDNNDFRPISLDEILKRLNLTS